ncbi:hypothetical protein WJX72_011239 [[Myrmecia] bisecta]|uniref:Kinesin-like protein n=1 Tax=[Myrmecia] bisecta TaxID=41462 RepID=A0AAW1R8L9_9CHLO
MQTPRSGNATNRRPSRGEDAPGSASKAARRTGSLNGPAENTLGERVKVVVRVRPPRGQETGGAIGLDQNGTRLVVFRENSVVPQSEFEYDQVLPPSATQADVYQAAVQPIVADVMNGYNGTIMAFGQTGAGKTYTLSSIQPDAIGMMPRAGAEIFEEISADPGNEYTVFMSYIQIYMELIQDLLRPENENLQIRESENGVFVAGVQEVEVKGMQDCLHLLQIGDRNRVVAFTNLNAHSSRSHAIVMLTVIKRRRLGATSRGEVQKVKVGKLFIVDLAGSERLKKSRSTGLRATEAKSINLSLTTLGMCINARADPNSQHVPFRDSKLTRLLQESLGGNAKTSLVIAVANAIEHVDESLQTLQFGARAMCVKTQAVINERVDYKLVSDLTSRLDTRDERTSVLEATLMSKEEELENLHGMLKGEQAQNAQVIQALQRERQLAEEEKERLLAQRNAELEAERLHKEQLAMQLQDTQAQAEDLLSMHEAEKSALLSELGYVKDAKQAAERDKDETIRKLENDLTRMQHQHALEQERLSQQLTMEREAALHRKQLELEAVQQKLRLAQEEGERLQAEGQRLRVQYEEASYQSEERWKARLQESESSAQRRLEQEQGSVAQLRSTVAGLEADVRELTGERNRLEVAVDGLGSDKHQLQEVLSALRRRAAELERHNAAMARSRSEFEQAWTRNKRLNQAARVIQAEYRRFRVRQLQRENMAGAQALWQARQAGQSLEDQKAAVEAARHAHLAWSGRALVANSMVLMQEGIETIRAAFLLPQKDLKQVSSAQAKLASLTGTPGTPRRQGSSAFGGILTPRGDSGSWSIASAGSAYGGGSPFITPMGTPRLGSGLGKSGLSFASPGVGSGGCAAAAMYEPGQSSGRKPGLRVLTCL